jgi:hypothetical protein
MKYSRSVKIALPKSKRFYKKIVAHIDNIGAFAYNILSLVTSEAIRSLKTK